MTFSRAALATVVVLLVMVAAATLALSPAARTAVARWLGVSGVRIETRSGPLPSPSQSTTPEVDDLDLGRSVTFAEAQAEVSFDIAAPGVLDAPDEVFVGSPPEGGVTLVYDPGPRLPRTVETGVGLLLTQFDAGLNRDLIRKLVDAGASVQGVEIDGGRGFWIEGQHLVYLENGGGGDPIPLRLAGSTLLWERGPMTFRMESGLSKGRAVAIARSIR